jgi:hypothetical protein
MEQASKKSSSHEGGLLLDSLHMRTRSPLCLGIVRTDVNRFLPRLIRPFPTSGFSLSARNANRIFLAGYYF